MSANPSQSSVAWKRPFFTNLWIVIFLPGSSLAGFAMVKCYNTIQQREDKAFLNHLRRVTYE